MMLTCDTILIERQVDKIESRKETTLSKNLHTMLWNMAHSTMPNYCWIFLASLYNQCVNLLLCVCHKHVYICFKSFHHHRESLTIFKTPNSISVLHPRLYNYPIDNKFFFKLWHVVPLKLSELYGSLLNVLFLIVQAPTISKTWYIQILLR